MSSLQEYSPNRSKINQVNKGQIPFNLLQVSTLAPSSDLQSRPATFGPAIAIETLTDVWVEEIKYRSPSFALAYSFFSRLLASNLDLLVKFRTCS